MVLNTQRQVDVLEQESDVTQTIDDYNVMKSPFSFNLWDYRDPSTDEDCVVYAPNWVLGNNRITATHGTDMELLTVSYPPIKPLEHKIITKVEIVTDILITGEGDTSPIFNSVSIGNGESYYACHSSTDGSVRSGDALTESKYGMLFTETLWGYSQQDIGNLLQSHLHVQFNVDLSSNQKTITFQNTFVRVSFNHFFKSESLAVENRLGLLGYRLDSDDELTYKLYIDDEGYLVEEYSDVNSPLFSIEFNEDNEGILYVDGEYLPDYQLDTFGYLYYGSVEQGSVYLFLSNADRTDTTYHTGDNLTLTIAFLNSVGGRVPNTELLIYLDEDGIIEAITDNNGYYTTTLSFNTVGNHTITVTNTNNESYAFTSNTETIEVI